MYIILLSKTRRHVDTIEKFYVCKWTKNKEELNNFCREYKKSCTAHVWRFCAYNKQADCNSREENKKAYIYIKNLFPSLKPYNFESESESENECSVPRVKLFTN